MKILHLACVAPPEIGGIGKVADREVALLRLRGHDARLIAPELPFDQNSPERSAVWRFPTFFRAGNASVLKGVLPELKRADVIHLHYPFYGTAEQVLLNANTLPPIIVTFHMDAIPGGWRQGLIAMHQVGAQDALLSRAAQVLVSSLDYARRSSLQRFAAQRPEKIAELPFGVDADLFSQGPGSRDRFLIPTGVPNLLFVGGMDRAHSFKGVPVLLDAFSKLEAHAHLLLVGDGDLRHAFEERAKQLNIATRTHFLGRLSQEDLVAAYRSSDIFVFPSTSRAEAFGLVALEAQAVGLPVVASDLPGVRTVVKQGETGLLVPPSDAEALASGIRTLLLDNGLRARMGSAARRHAERLSWDAHVDGLLGIYQRVCASPSS